MGNLQPDSDAYVEDISGNGDPGCDFFKTIVGQGLYLLVASGGAVYRCSHDVRMRSHIGQASEDIGDEVRPPGACRPSGILCKDSSVQDALPFWADFLLIAVFEGRDLMLERLMLQPLRGVLLQEQSWLSLLLGIMFGFVPSPSKD